MMWQVIEHAVKTWVQANAVDATLDLVALLVWLLAVATWLVWEACPLCKEVSSCVGALWHFLVAFKQVVWVAAVAGMTYVGACVVCSKCCTAYNLAIKCSL